MKFKLFRNAFDEDDWDLQIGGCDCCTTTKRYLKNPSEFYSSDLTTQDLNDAESYFLEQLNLINELRGILKMAVPHDH